MSNNVDKRVVEMQFDNKQFESGVETSLKSISNLKKGLNFEEASKSLSNLEKAGKSFSLDGIASGVDTIASKFSALGIIGITALQNITNKAVDAGMRIASALTIDPIKMGFQEYETQINAVQTILANTESKGKTLQDVNKALDELNAYADKTIYNFTEMTRNIGTFTAAGVDLDTSVAAIKGIANLAAVSGSTSQQASTAMYQLSQALASGTVKLMDWNSVVNAGMGGQVFQDALKETARVHGVAIDDMIEKEGSFRETLSNGWLSAEILTETLSKFTGDLTEEQLKSMGYTEEQTKAILKMGETANDAATKVKTFTQLIDTLKEAAQSGWTQTWEIIVGDFEEAKVMLTEVSDTIGAMIGSSAEARNQMLSDWKALGGRTDLIESVRNVFQALMGVITPIKEAFREVFPPTTGEQLHKITASIRNFTEKLKMGEETAENLKRTFKGVFSILDIGVKIVSAIAKGFAKLVGFIAPAGNGILSLTAILGDGITKLNEFLESTNVFNKIVEKITSVLGAIITGVRNFVSAIGEAINGFFNIDTSAVDSFTDKLKMRFEPFIKLGQGIKRVFEALGNMIKKLAPVFVAVGNGIADLFGGLATKVADAIANADFNAIIDLINGFFTGGLILSLKKLVNNLTEITENTGGFIENLKGILDGVRGSVEAYEKNIQAKTLLKIASAIGILAASIVAISMVDSEKLTASLAAMSTMFIELIGSLMVFSRIESIKFTKMASQVVGIFGLATSILILASALKKIASVDLVGMAKGVLGIAALSKILTTAVKDLSGEKARQMVKGSVGIIAFSTSIVILTSAVKKLGDLNLGQLVKGLLGVMVVCNLLSAFLTDTDLDGMSMLKGAGIMLLAGAINILAKATSNFASLNFGAMLQGLVAVGVVLTELSMFIKGIGDSKNLFSTGVGLTLIATAMVILSKAITNLASLNLNEFCISLSAMFIALVSIIVALHGMPDNMLGMATALIGVSTGIVILASAIKILSTMSLDELIISIIGLGGALAILTISLNAMSSALPGAAALLVAAGAIGMLVPSLALLGLIPIDNMVRSLLYLAGVFAVLGGATVLLTPLIPVMATLSATLLTFGAACLAIGVGAVALSAGLAGLSTSITVVVGAIIAIISGVIGLIPALIKAVGEGLILLLDLIAGAGESLLGAFTTILLSLIGALKAAIPPLLEAIGVLLESLLAFIVSYVPKMVVAAMELIIGLLNGIAQKIPDIILAAVNVIDSFLQGIAMAIPRLIDAGFRMIITFINGIADAIRTNIPLVIEAIGNLVDAIGDAFEKLVSGGLDIGKRLIEGLKKGVKEKANSLKDSVVNTVKNAWNGVKNFLGIRSPSRLAMEAGGYVDEGFVIGLENHADDVSDAAKGVGVATMEGLQGSISKISDIINSDTDITPSIRPVIDMSNATLPTGDMMDKAVKSLSTKADILDSQFSTELNTTVNHTFDTLRIEGVNNEQEFVAASDYAVEEILTELMRRQNRL